MKALRRSRKCLSQARGIKPSRGHQAGQGAASRARGSKYGRGQQVGPGAASGAVGSKHGLAYCPRDCLVTPALLAAHSHACCPSPCLMPLAQLDAPSLTQTHSSSSQCLVPQFQILPAVVAHNSLMQVRSIYWVSDVVHLIMQLFGRKVLMR